MQLELTDDQALVFFDWLARMDEAESLPFRHPAEEKVLWLLQAQLEKALVAPLRADYESLIERARSRVAD